MADFPAPRRNRQYGPYPEKLASLVELLRYKDGWVFGLSDVERDHDEVHGDSAGGLTFEVTITTPDAYHPERKRSVLHYFPVPAATYDERSWRRWLLARIIDVETHEACEFFRLVYPELLNDPPGPDMIVRPFAPNHGPGRDPYTIFDYATDEDRRTSFRGELNS